MAESSRSNDVEMTDEEQARRIAAQAQPEGYAHISVPGWEYLSEGECIVTQDPQDEYATPQRRGAAIVAYRLTRLPGAAHGSTGPALVTGLPFAHST